MQRERSHHAKCGRTSIRSAATPASGKAGAVQVAQPAAILALSALRRPHPHLRPGGSLESQPIQLLLGRALTPGKLTLHAGQCDIAIQIHMAAHILLELAQCDKSALKTCIA